MVRRLFIATHGLLSSCGAQALESAGSGVAACGRSSCGTRAPEHAGTVVAACGLQSTWARGLSSCGMRALERTGLVAPQRVGS